MSKSEYKVGMVIQVPARPQWGPGKIVAIAEERLYVYFRDDLSQKAKTILTTVITPVVAEEQTDAVLDSLPPATHDGVNWMLPKNYEKVMARAAAAAAK
jgi:hypothetical protein